MLGARSALCPVLAGLTTPSQELMGALWSPAAGPLNLAAPGPPCWVVTAPSPLPSAPLWAWGAGATRLGLTGLLPAFRQSTFWLEPSNNQSLSRGGREGEGGEAKGQRAPSVATPELSFSLAASQLCSPAPSLLSEPQG